MKRKLSFILCSALMATAIFAQSDEDLFGDGGIEVLDDVSAKSDMSKGIIFNAGGVKIGGSLTSEVNTDTILYKQNGDSLGENIYNTKISPDLNAMISVDARPTETLRIYTKFGFAYPFENKANVILADPNKPEVSITDWFKLKELFTDFSYKDTAFFRFGIHTVSWGTGYFYSPLSDLINTSSIDPENPDKQVDGSLNLRTQIVFPNSQNCLWLYVIPSMDFENQSAESYARETAFAGKADIVVGDCELGLGGYYKYQNAPKAMLTASGAIKNWQVYSEFVYSYGADKEWKENVDWDDKTSIFQATAGFARAWMKKEEPKISLAVQYAFESNDVDFLSRTNLYGHNVFVNVTKAELFNNEDLSLSLFAKANFGAKDVTANDIRMLKPEAAGKSDAELAGYVKDVNDNISTLYAKLLLTYNPIKEFSVNVGPTLNFSDFDTNPTVGMHIGLKLGGGNF